MSPCIGSLYGEGPRAPHPDKIDIIVAATKKLSFRMSRSFPLCSFARRVYGTQCRKLEGNPCRPGLALTFGRMILVVAPYKLDDLFATAIR